MSIAIDAFELTIFILSILTFFCISIFVLFQYLAHDKQIKEQIDEILIEHAKYIKKEFDKHKEEQIELFNETQKLANEIIERFNSVERLHAKNFKTTVDVINENVNKIKKLEDKISLRYNEITNLQDKIKEKDGIIARKTKQIQRLKDEI